MTQGTLQLSKVWQMLGTLTLAVLLFSLLGCGGEGEDRSAGTRDASTETPGPTAETGTAAPGTGIAPIELPGLEMPDQAILQQVHGKLQGAITALRQRQGDSAINYFNAAIELLPDAPVLYYYLAVGLSSQSKYEEALASLEKAAELGFCDPLKIEHDPVFVGVRELDGWLPLQDQMQGERTRQRPASQVSYRELDPEQEPAFEDLAELQTHYTELLNQRSGLLAIYPDVIIMPHVWDMLNHKMAALRKFQERELDDTQKIQVDLDLLKTVNAYENPQQTPWLPSTVEIVTRVANEFIQRHSDEPEPASQASYVQIRAEALGRDPSSITDGDLTEDIERLTAIHDKYPGTAGALFALMDVLEMIKDRDGLGSEAMATMVQKLKSGYADHPGLRQMAYKLQPYVLAVEGLPEFTVTDLSGKEWNSRNLGGGVILFDFWATWCAPCLQELPNLIQLYSMYKDRGFQILGISLDEQQKISEDDLKKWIKENNITWPIVYSGQGWSTTGVHECGATAGIPFPILVGRDGKVITAAEGATGQNLAKELAKLFGES